MGSRKSYSRLTSWTHITKASASGLACKRQRQSKNAIHTTCFRAIRLSSCCARLEYPRSFDRRCSHLVGRRVGHTAATPNPTGACKQPRPFECADCFEGDHASQFEEEKFRLVDLERRQRSIGQGRFRCRARPSLLIGQAGLNRNDWICLLATAAKPTAAQK